MTQKKETFKIPCRDEEKLFCLKVTYPEQGSRLFVKFNSRLKFIDSIVVNHAEDAIGMTCLDNGDVIFESAQLAIKLKIVKRWILTGVGSPE